MGSDSSTSKVVAPQVTGSVMEAIVGGDSSKTSAVDNVKSNVKPVLEPLKLLINKASVCPVVTGIAPLINVPVASWSFKPGIGPAPVAPGD